MPELESKRFSLWTRLTQRFALEAQPNMGPPVPSVATMIVPVTDADQLVKDPLARASSENLTAGAGSYVPYQTVPVNERWYVYFLRRGASTGTTLITITYGGAGPYSFTMADTAGSLLHLGGMRFAAGDTLGMVTTGNGADTAIPLSVWYEREFLEG